MNKSSLITLALTGLMAAALAAPLDAQSSQQQGQGDGAVKSQLTFVETIMIGSSLTRRFSLHLSSKVQTHRAMTIRGSERRT
ncbi:MAG: hypothetical protein V3T85_12890 [Acidiferrobacterales bacterium]